MSFTELKEQVTRLSAEDRFRLSALLADLDQANETEFRSEVERRMKAMDSGVKMTMEQFEEQHRQRGGE